MRLSLEQSVLMLLEGTLSADEHFMLMCELGRQPEFAERLIGEVIVDDLLQQHVDECRGLAHSQWVEAFLEKQQQAEVDDCWRHSQCITPDETHSLLSPTFSARQELPQRRPWTHRALWKKAGFVLLSAACLLLFVKLGFQFADNIRSARFIAVTSPPPGKKAPDQQKKETGTNKEERSNHSQNMPLPSQREGRGLAMIESISEEVNGHYFAGQEFIADQKLQLQQGSLTLRFPVGVTAILSGPAELEFVSAMTAILRSGRLTASVEGPARGFTIITPHADIVDLGTRFGINVGASGESDVLVFEGMVDVHYSNDKEESERKIRRLSVGEALRIKQSGIVHPLTVIEKGPGPADWSVTIDDPASPIAKISDNFIGPNQPIYYAVVRKGFDEDALAYVDRAYQWNSLPNIPFPEKLRGADYIQTINSLKWVINLEVQLSLRHDADIYVLMDTRIAAPSWLKNSFKKTEEMIGMDEIRPWARPGPDLPEGPMVESARTLGVGAGNSVDLAFSIWKKHGTAGDVVVFGGLFDSLSPFATTRKQAIEGGIHGSMYGIVIVRTAP